MPKDVVCAALAEVEATRREVEEFYEELRRSMEDVELQRAA